MLFNSLSYLYVFLPGTVAGYYALSKLQSVKLLQWWLIAVSMAFYAYWNPIYIWLLLTSILWNFLAAKFLQTKKILLIAIAGNVALLGYFKYANFFVDTINTALHLGWTFHEVVLPLAISFFTFQQIAYLVDVHRQKLQPLSFREYALFVSFFPQLIAGPIVRHNELVPQLRLLHTPTQKDIAIGLTFVGVGLWKKMIMASAMASIADPMFQSPTSLGMAASWTAAVAFGLQIYFDFSGYTDMAIGSAQLFGIRLPENFLSPYKSVTLREFWTRWHSTLSSFLRDYLYVPLGGSRHNWLRTGANLMITMLLGGLWHGASWTFVLWGGVHGALLVIAHYWHKTRFSLPTVLAWICTMVSIAATWVLFRSDSVATAMHVYKGMVGLQGPGLTLTYKDSVAVTFAIALVLLLPNMQQWLASFRQEKPDTAPAITLRYYPNLPTGIFIGILAIWAISQIDTITPFIYFAF